MDTSAAKSLDLRHYHPLVVLRHSPLQRDAGSVGWDNAQRLEYLLLSILLAPLRGFLPEQYICPGTDVVIFHVRNSTSRWLMVDQPKKGCAFSLFTTVFELRNS